MHYNFRLNLFLEGFLALNQEDALGNVAMKDQVMALQWIKDNIKNFGGNPDLVTIFGISSGSVCVDLHVLSDLSKGLFHRSIAMSGSIFNSWGFSTPEEAEEQAFALGTLLNNNKTPNSTDDLLQILTNASASDIVLKTELLKPVKYIYNFTIIKFLLLQLVLHFVRNQQARIYYR